MARFNEILVGRYNRYLQKLLEMKGPPVAPQLASEIQPVFPMFLGYENRFLEQWERYGLLMNSVAVAGQQSAARIRMPAASNVIAVLESIVVIVGAAQQVNLIYAVGTGDLTTQNFGSNLNSARKSPSPAGTLLTGSAAVTSFAAVAAIGNVIKAVALGANASVEFISDAIQELTIAPNEAYTVQGGVVNTSLLTSFIWRERFLENAERQ